MGRPAGFSTKFSSDSDSGNGDAQEKQSPSRHALRNQSSSSTSMIGRKAHQRRHARQSSTKKSESKHLRNERKHPKSSKSRKVKSSRELTESDSGQEMHFSFDNEATWSSVPEGQDIGSFSSNPSKHQKTRISYFKDSSHNERNESEKFGTQFFSSYNSNSSNYSSDRMEGRPVFSENIPIVENSFDINRTSGGSEDGQGFVTQDFNIPSNISPNNMIPLLPPVDSVQAQNNNDNDDAGYAEDFNIIDDIFNHKIAESSPRDLENHRMLETEISFRNQFQYEEFNTSKTLEMSLLNNDVSKHAQQTPMEEKPRTNMVMYATTKEDSLDLGIVSEDRSINSKHSSSDSLFNEPNSDHSTSPFSDIVSVSRLEEKQVTEQQVTAVERKKVDEKPATVEISCPKPEERERITENKEPTLLDKQNIESKASAILDKQNIDIKSSDKQNIESKQNIERKPWNENNSLNLSGLKEALDSVSLKEVKATLENKMKSCSLPNLSSASVNRETFVSSNTATRNSMSTVELSNTGNGNKENAAIVGKKSKKSKSKKKKNKTKLAMNIQSIEAEAYSMFELAKSVLLQSRNTVLVRPLPLIQPVNVGVNQKLQVAAFEIGLFALHIQNYSSPNWRARTYSTYVSWIENLAIDIGSLAQQILNEKWEGTLTPGEAIQVATRASRSGDQTTRRTAAELVLSCLPYAQSLSSTDITNSISLCYEQDEEMLERACSAVENASLNGGIQPELLFFISRKWHDLYKQKQGENNNEAPNQREIGLDNPSFSLLNNSDRQELQPVYITPAEFVQEQMHIQAQEILGRQIPRNTQQDHFTWMYPQYIGPLHHCPLPQQAIHSRRIPNIESYSIPYNNFPEELNLSEIPRHLQNCYRVGMKAMEALTLPLPDDRPEVKYAMSPPSSDDIRWMCKIAASLGPTCLKNFCKVVYNAVTSPYLLHDLALEAARNFALYNPAQLNPHLRSPSVSPIVHKAMAMYTELVHHDLVFLSSRGHTDFVDLLRRARSAFCMAAGGMARFNEILEVIRKTYPKKRELWQLIMNGLSKA